MIKTLTPAAEVTALFGHLRPRERKAAIALVRRSMLRGIYERDPVAFAYDCFEWRSDERLTDYQAEILAALTEHGRVAVRGPHGLGKTTIMAFATIWFALTREGDDWKAATMASVWRQLDHVLWPEIRKWASRLKFETIGRDPFDPRSELLRRTLHLETGSAFAVASDQPSAIEGVHGDRLLYVFDEAKAIPDAIFDAAEGAFSGAGADTSQEALALVTSTPGEPLGRFYDIHARRPGFEEWWVRHVSVEEAIRAARISAEWVEARGRQWGEDSAVYQNRVLGEFASDDEQGVIPLRWVEAAIERWRAWNEDGRYVAEFTALGVDVANGGSDDTVLAARFDRVITDLRVYPTADVMETVGHVAGVLRKFGGKAVVDSIGVGAGVIARLKELGLPYLGFNASERADGKDSSGEMEFANRRAQAWWHLRELLDPNSGEEIHLPPDDRMIGDLVAPKWSITSGGKLKIESKDDIRKRLGRSTDVGDAVVMAFAAELIRRLGRAAVYRW